MIVSFRRSRRNIEAVEPGPASQRSVTDLMMQFESIGAGCEFGVVQRCCGAEPLDLLRFTGSAVANLVHLLESGLDDFLSPEDIGIEVQEADQEYLVFSRGYGDFRSHTHAFVERHDKATILTRETKKAGYLKRRFLSDWSDAARVYVHCGCEDEASILKLHAALRVRSDCVLLWVGIARSPQERGRVDVLAPGLLRGYVAHHGTFDNGPRLDLPGWALVCRNAIAIVRGLSGSSPSGPNPIAAQFDWSHAPGGALQSGPTSGRCRVLHATAFSVAVGQVRVTAKIPGKTHCVFSVWVRLAASFEGRNMILTADDVVLVNSRRADLSLCETWQQIWIIVRAVEPKELLHISLYVEATKGSEFAFGGWQFEEGGIPDESLLPTEAALIEELGPGGMKPPLSQPVRSWAARALVRAASRVQPPEPSTPPSLDEMTANGFLAAANSMFAATLFDEADSLLRAGMILFPWQAEIFTHYALCAELRGSSIEAVDRWQNVVDFFPQFALGHYRLAESMEKCGKVDRALAIIECALPNHGNDVIMVAVSARVYAVAQQWGLAVALWDRAIAMTGARPEWRDARAAVAERAALILSDADPTGLFPAAEVLRPRREIAFPET